MEHKDSCILLLSSLSCYLAYRAQFLEQCIFFPFGCLLLLSLLFEHGNESVLVITERYVRSTLFLKPVRDEYNSQHPVSLVQVDTELQDRSAYIITVLSHKLVIVSSVVLCCLETTYDRRYMDTSYGK